MPRVFPCVFTRGGHGPCVEYQTRSEGNAYLPFLFSEGDRVSLVVFPPYTRAGTHL